MKGKLSLLWVFCVSGVLAQTPQLVQVSAGARSIATAISANGNYVVGGTLVANSPRPFLWQRGVGERVLPLPAGAYYAIARGVSNDGSVVVGDAYFGSTSTDHRILPVVWRAPNYQPQMLSVPDSSGGAAYYVTGVSGDGQVIVGWWSTRNSQRLALYWRDNTYTIVGSGQFSAVSRCGGYAVGYNEFTPFRFTFNPFRIETLGADWYPRSVASGGGAVVGTEYGFSFRGVFWDSCGAISLGRFNGIEVELFAISDDGRVAGGWMRSRALAVRWKRERGFLDGYDDLSQTFASVLSGRFLRSVHAISADGRYLAGSMWVGPEYYAFWLDTAGR